MFAEEEEDLSVFCRLVATLEIVSNGFHLEQDQPRIPFKTKENHFAELTFGFFRQV